MSLTILLSLITVLMAECLILFYYRARVGAFSRECMALRRAMFEARREILDITNAERAFVMQARNIPVIRVRFLPMDEEIVIMHPNLSLLNAAWENGIGIPTACLGNARCGTCKIRVIEPKGKLPAKAAQEKITLSMFTRLEDVRLACMIKPREDMVVAIDSEQALIDTVLPPRTEAERMADTTIAGGQAA